MCKKIDELMEENAKLKEELARLEAEKHTIECRFEVSEDTLNCIRSCLRAAENDIDQLKAQLAEALVAPNTADLPGRIDRFLDSQPAVPKGDYAAPNQIADALESLEWKGCSIGHKVVLANAVAALRCVPCEVLSMSNRERFEAWYLAEFWEGSNGGRAMLKKEPCGGYTYAKPQELWKVWQAAQPAAGEPLAWVTDGKEIDCAYKDLEPGGRLPAGTKLYAMRAQAVEGN